ncbi:MAG: DoxX family protein [Bacteroidota bacterium]|nr:DoxX family protein [Bacteroidota bacterium]
MFKKFLNTELNPFRISMGLLILRLSVAILMIPHGYNKMAHFAEKQAKFMSFMGLSSEISLALTIGAELFCSLLLAAGILTRFTLIPLIVAMMVAVFVSHQGEIFGDGQEAFLYMITYVVLFIAGPGKFSMDTLLFKQNKSLYK